MRLAVWIFAILSVAAVATAQGRLGKPADEAAIQRNQEMMAAALNKHDARAVAATFAIDADWLSPAGYRSGRAEIESVYGRLFTGVDKNATFAFQPLKIRFLTPDVAVADVDALVTGTTRNIDVHNHGTAIFLKSNGAWLRVSLRVTEMSQP